MHKIGETGKPSLARSALRDLMECSPFCLALGLEPAANDGDIALLLKAQPHLRCAEAADQLDVAAIAGVLDNALAIGANSTVPSGSRPATIDLRWEMFRAPPLADIIVTASSATRAPEAVFVQGDILEASTGALLGRANASVSYSASKEGAVELEKATPPPAVQGSDFCQWMGLTGGQGAFVAPYETRMRGMAALPYWHGGALMSALTAAATRQAASQATTRARLLAATVNFDVFAIDAPLEIDCSDNRITRTRAAVHARAAQAGRGVTTRLTAHFALGQ